MGHMWQGLVVGAAECPVLVTAGSRQDPSEETVAMGGSCQGSVGLVVPVLFYLQ